MNRYTKKIEKIIKSTREKIQATCIKAKIKQIYIKILIRDIVKKLIRIINKHCKIVIHLEK